MVQSDTLSYLHHLNLEVNNNDAIPLLPKQLFITPLDMSLAECIQAVHNKDKVVVNALVVAKNGSVLPMQSMLADWMFEDSLVFFQQ